MLYKKIFIFLCILMFSTSIFANTPRSTGKYKNWESFMLKLIKEKFVLLKPFQQKELLHQFREENQNYL